MDPTQKPPVSFEAEMALLAALLSSNKTYDLVGDFLRPEHFADHRHGEIYAAIAHLLDAGHTADAITLNNHFKANGLLDEIGGTDYLAELAASVVTIINAADYARTIRDRWVRRCAIEQIAVTSERLHAVKIEESAEDIIAAAQASLDSLAESKADGGIETLDEVLAATLREVEDAHKAGGGIVGLATGIEAIDNHLGGLKRGNLILLGGRPSIGKSTLAANMIRNIGEAGHTVAWFSLEMGGPDCARVMLASEAGVSATDMERGRISPDGFIRLLDTKTKFSKYQIHIDPSPGLTVAQMTIRARRLKPALVVVDHLGLSRGASDDTRPRSKYERISEISNALKVMAKRLDCPVLALAQLSRALESRDDKRPMLADLRDSGDLEQDADAICFLHREDYYLARTAEEDRAFEWQQLWDRWHGQAELIIAKQRTGPVGTVRLKFTPERSLFTSLETTHRNQQSMEM